MTRLIALFIGNPLAFIGVVIAVFLFGATTGGTAAWKIQGVRVTAEQQKHTDYVQDQTRKFQEAKDAADRDREQARAAYERASKELAASVESGEVLRRCVAAGKCGVRTIRVPDKSACSPSVRLPAAGGTDAPSANAVPASPGTTAEDPVIGDCAITTLMLNQLQTNILNQPGYGQ